MGAVFIKPSVLIDNVIELRQSFIHFTFFIDIKIAICTS
jgi:hypothetical protein